MDLLFSSIFSFQIIELQPQMIRTKSSEGLPFPMILSGSIITFLWFLYGVATREKLLIIQNGIFCLMASAQVSLCIIYPAKAPKDIGSTENKKNNKKQN